MLHRFRQGATRQFFQFLKETEILGLRLVCKAEEKEINEEYFRPLCQSLKIFIAPLTKPIHAYSKSISFYIITFAEDPSNVHPRSEEFVVSSVEDVQYIIENDPSRILGYNALLAQGLHATLEVVRNSRIVETIFLQSFISHVQLTNGSKVYIKEVAKQVYPLHGPKNTRARPIALLRENKIEKDGTTIISKFIYGHDTTYTIYWNQNEFFCPDCQECTCSCDCFLYAFEENRNLIQKCELVSNFVGLIPKLEEGRPLRKNEIVEINDRMYEYGYLNHETDYKPDPNWRHEQN